MNEHEHKLTNDINHSQQKIISIITKSVEKRTRYSTHFQYSGIAAYLLVCVVRSLAVRANVKLQAEFLFNLYWWVLALQNTALLLAPAPTRLTPRAGPPPAPASVMRRGAVSGRRGGGRARATPAGGKRREGRGRGDPNQGPSPHLSPRHKTDDTNLTKNQMLITAHEHRGKRAHRAYRSDHSSTASFIDRIANRMHRVGYVDR